MTMILANGIVFWPDGSTVTSANISYQANINSSTVPTLLTQFTNNLGNYGAIVPGSGGQFLAQTDFNQTVVGSNSTPAMYITWNGSQVVMINTNCNCFCNC